MCKILDSPCYISHFLDVQALRIGIDLLVVSESWIRRLDESFPQPSNELSISETYVKRLKTVSENINKNGCKFGLWIEPDLLTQESVKHPIK